MNADPLATGSVAIATDLAEPMLRETRTTAFSRNRYVTSRSKRRSFNKKSHVIPDSLSRISLFKQIQATYK